MPGFTFGAPQTMLSASPAPTFDLAHAQPIGVRMTLDRHDVADDHAGEGWRDRTQLFDLHAGHGEQLGQRFGGDRRIAELAQPGLGELHVVGFPVT